MTKLEYLEVITYLRTLVARYLTRYPFVDGSGTLSFSANKKDLLFSFGIITERGIESRIIEFIYDEDTDQFTHTVNASTGRRSWITLDYDSEVLYTAAHFQLKGGQRV